MALVDECVDKALPVGLKCFISPIRQENAREQRRHPGEFELRGIGRKTRSEKIPSCLLLLLFFAFVGLFFGTVRAAPVSPDKAQRLVRGWLRADARPLGSRIGNQVDSVETFTDGEGQATYYVVYLRPNGFVIVPAEDQVEPVICFVSGGCYDPSESNPLGALVSRDLPGRVNATREIQKKLRDGGFAGKLTETETAIRYSAQKAFGKWTRLLAEDSNTPVLKAGLPNISDVWVEPFLETEWGQDICCYSPARACYNYYTPPGLDGDSDNYYCGCVATAMAQYMYFRLHPTLGVGTPTFTIYVDGNPESRQLRGGDGSGGPYSWDIMPTETNCSTPLAQIQAVGALTHDAGVAVSMQYTATGSGAYMFDAAEALVDTFDYSKAIFGLNYSTGLNGMLNPNLDSGNPVILGVRRSGGGHAIVTDGYGYNNSTLYHHLNMGWDGYYDAWYNLPNISSSPSYDTVESTIYNIYVTGTGEIISGRVTEDGSGTPINEATVTANKTGGGTYQAITNNKGIYAITNVPSNSSYTVSVTKSDYSFDSNTADTGESEDWDSISGNCWGINFTGTASGPEPPAASDSEVSAGPGVSKSIELVATDDGQPNPPGILSYIITSLPVFGTLSDPAGGEINSVPYTLLVSGNEVIYTSNACYAGQDGFEFNANDGGDPPNGGDSNIATVTITVVGGSGDPEIIYETHFDTGLPASWTIIDGGDTEETWKAVDDSYGYSSPYWTGVFMIVDSALEACSMDEQLITHSIDCTGLSDVKLRFKHKFYYWEYGYGEVGDVDINFGGNTWQNVARYEGASYSGLVEIDLSNYGADGASNLRIRWRYYNTEWEWYWGIDDVEIIASSSASTAAPAGDFECDCDVDYDDLVALTAAWTTGPGDDNWDDRCDIAEPADDYINERDYAVFAQNWLTGVE